MNKKFWPAMICALILLGFQNCSKAGFQSQGADLSSTSVDGLLKLDMNSEQTGSSPLVQVSANLGLIPNVQSVLWDNSLGDDLSYCDQTTSMDKATTTFLCSEAGWLTVYLTVHTTDGDTLTYSMKVYVQGDGSTPTVPSTPLTGPQLYAQYCSGCHGPIESSTKRGINISLLNTGLTTIDQMSGLQNELSEDQKAAIISALNN